MALRGVDLQEGLEEVPGDSPVGHGGQHVLHAPQRIDEQHVAERPDVTGNERRVHDLLDAAHLALLVDRRKAQQVPAGIDLRRLHVGERRIRPGSEHGERAALDVAEPGRCPGAGALEEIADPHGSRCLHALANGGADQQPHLAGAGLPHHLGRQADRQLALQVRRPQCFPHRIFARQAPGGRDIQVLARTGRDTGPGHRDLKPVPPSVPVGGDALDTKQVVGRQIQRQPPERGIAPQGSVAEGPAGRARDVLQARTTEVAVLGGEARDALLVERIPAEEAQVHVQRVNHRAGRGCLPSQGAHVAVHPQLGGAAGREDARADEDHGDGGPVARGGADDGFQPPDRVDALPACVVDDFRGGAIEFRLAR